VSTDFRETYKKMLPTMQFVRQGILTAYPNPQRIDCPGREELKETAARTDYERLFEEPVWEHITHCSPCYKEYLEIVRKRKQQ
jgi:hypothetical protein